MENFTLLTSGGFAERDLVNDGWTDILGRLVNRMRDQSSGAGRDLAAVMELADFEKMEQIRARVDDIVEDPATAEALKPWYRQFCKRPCFHDEYLQAFNRPNVALVDTDGRGVDAITTRRRRRRRSRVRGRLPDLRHRVRGRDRLHADGPATTSSAHAD